MRHAPGPSPRLPRRPGASRRLICPFPFWKPVSAASPFTLEFRHSPATLRADQVDDGRDHTRIRFAGQYIKDLHDHSPIHRSGNYGRGRHGPETTEMCRAGLLRSSALRTGWLRSPSRPRQSPAASLPRENASAVPKESGE